MMAIPNATVKITRACKITSTPLKFHKALPKEVPKYAPVELEIERKRAGNDKTMPAPIKPESFLGDVFFVDLSLNISPDKNRMANVPIPTTNWKIAA